MAEAFEMTVAACCPLAGGVLSGKFRGPSSPGGTTHIARESRGAREHTAGAAVLAVAGELGVSAAPATVRGHYPCAGASTAAEPENNLGAVNLALSDDALDRVDAATDFAAGFPGDLIANLPPFVFGEVSADVDGR